ncbi:hypothetical protein BC829DRAFT_419530 [Chytridium lagenaria]|nr:hypothetical protein BC829DRAFT_419530 [Chytridium lagenaria]
MDERRPPRMVKQTARVEVKKRGDRLGVAPRAGVWESVDNHLGLVLHWVEGSRVDGWKEIGEVVVLALVVLSLWSNMAWRDERVVAGVVEVGMMTGEPLFIIRIELEWESMDSKDGGGAKEEEEEEDIHKGQGDAYISAVYYGACWCRV